MLLKRLYNRVNHRFIYNYENRHETLERQQAFLATVPAPKDDVERGYAHYLCQMYYNYSRGIRLLFNAAGFFLWPLSWLLFALRGARLPALKDLEKHGAAVERCKTDPADILPEDLARRYGAADTVPIRSDYRLDASARRWFAACVKRYPLRPYFLYMVLVRLGEACANLHAYAPRALVVYTRERDFAIPVITAYCEENGVDHIGFMHGDFLYGADRAHLRFTAYYVWDEHYAGILRSLCWPAAQLRVYTPEKLRCGASPPADGQYEYFLTYYFGGETEERMAVVRDVLTRLEKKGLRCRVRPHPRFSDEGRLRQLFSQEELEDWRDTAIAQSLSRTRWAAALNSTVLLEAAACGWGIAVDDLSDPVRFALLKERRFIILSKPHRLLSELLAEVEG